MHRFVLAMSLALAGGAPALAAAQDVSGISQARGPRFLVAATPSATPIPIDVSRTPSLNRRVAVELNDVPLDQALKQLAVLGGFKLSYSTAVIPFDRRVRLKASDITVAAALTEVLLNADVDVVFSTSARAVLVPQRTGPRGVPVAVGVVAGRVTDAKTGDGLVGADVWLEGTRSRTTTGEKGYYKLIDVTAGSYTLGVRRVGYAKQSRAVTVAAEQETTADVALQPVATQLNEIVTTVTGEQRRVELGHVVGRINADSLVREAPVTNLSELLTGRVPGLQVFQSAGTVGGEVRLQVRGPNSLLLNTEPIVIVDGVRYTNAGARRGPGSSGVDVVEPTSPLNDINPSDILSVEVVKGPSAATLYGTDASNGVIVIATKHGLAGATRWYAYAKGMRTSIPEQQYADNYWSYGRSLSDNSPRRCVLQSVGSGSCVQDSVVRLANPLNDPELTVFGSQPRWNYGANASGGRQDLRYYFSSDFEDATGPVRMPAAVAEQVKTRRGVVELPEEMRKPNAFDKLNLRANVAAQLGERADLRVNVGYLHSATRSLGIARNNPYSYGVFTASPTNPYGEQGSAPEEVFAQTSTDRVDRSFSSANGQWRPASWLATRATIGLDLANRNRYSLVRRGDTPNNFSTVNGSVAENRVRQVATTAELGATATARRGRVSSRTAVGAQYVRNLSDALFARGNNLPPGGSSVGEGASKFTRQTYGETVTLGSYIEETLGLNERLFLIGALRVDGASAFGQDYDATVYPKASVSWLVSEEPFLPRIAGLEELRLRYAYGASGQQPLPAWGRAGYGVETVFADGVTMTGVDVVGLGNPRIRPERVQEHEIGFDATALRSRLQLGFTWYKRRTVDQIVSLDLPPGLGAIYTNLGLTTQHGFEAELTAHVLDTRLLSVDVMAQHGLHRTKLADLGGAVALRFAEGGWAEGYPLGARFQRPILGYNDANGDGIIVLDEIQQASAETYVGESTPPISQTLTAAFGFFERRIRLSALFERRSGFTQINQIKANQCAVLLLCRASNDPSTPPLEQAEATLVRQGPSYNYMEPGDFTRLREVALAVDLPLRLTRALRVRSATATLAGRNLALWTDFGGPDPESATVNGAAGGVADGIPQGRSWSLRIDLGL